jgi:hypothetical protein
MPRKNAKEGPRDVARHLMLKTPQQMREWLAAEKAFESTFDGEDRRTYIAVKAALAAAGDGKRPRRRTMRGSGRRRKGTARTRRSRG